MKRTKEAIEKAPKLDRIADLAVCKLGKAIKLSYPRHKIAVHAEALSSEFVRIYAVGRIFGLLGHWERSGLIWRIADRSLNVTELNRIMSIVVLTPKEFDVEYNNKPVRPE